MKVTDVNGVKVYDLTVGKTLPQWLSERHRRSLAKDADYRRRIELVQDFSFQSASQRIKMSRDSNYIVATGVYKPMVKVYDTRELSLKFERHLDAEVVQLEVLSDDYTKLVFLGVDRSLSFHAAYGQHYTTRVPSFGRDLAYDRQSCDLYVVGSSSSIFRLNLDHGRFMTPFETSHRQINCVESSGVHRLVAAGGVDGTASFWDPRERKQVGACDVAEAMGLSSQPEITSMSFDGTGLKFLAGASDGSCAVFDMRSSKPLAAKEHPYGMPIVSVAFQDMGENVVTADAKVVKIWNARDASPFTTIEVPVPINDVCLARGRDGSTSGLMMLAVEQERIMSFYVPRFGAAPPWASFLDNLTEELEETKNDDVVYDDYKFVTRPELEKMGLGHLMGTNLLKAYMHGFFMDLRLYDRVKAVTEPFAFDKWRKARINEKREKKQSQRISVKRTLPKVNKALAERLIDDDAETKAKPLVDARFGALFEDPDFEVDETTEAFRLAYPSGTKKSGSKRQTGKSAQQQPAQDGSDEDVAIEEKGRAAKGRSSHPKRTRVMVLSEGIDEDFGAASDARARENARGPTMRDRLATKEEGDADMLNARILGDGNIEMSFIPKDDHDGAKNSGEGLRGGRKKTRRR